MHFLVFPNARTGSLCPNASPKAHRGGQETNSLCKCGLNAEGLNHQPALATAKGESGEPEDWHFKQAPTGMQCSSLLA